MYMKDQEDKCISMKLKEMLRHEGGNSVASLAVNIYGANTFSNKSFVMDLLKKPEAELMETLKTAEPVALYRDILKTYQTEVQGKLNEIQSRINKLQHILPFGFADIRKLINFSNIKYNRSVFFFGFATKFPGFILDQGI